jgi:hypothetical protein
VEPPISSLIASAERGDRTAADALFTALYSDLHRLAKRQLASNRGGVREAFISGARTALPISRIPRPLTRAVKERP